MQTFAAMLECTVGDVSWAGVRMTRRDYVAIALAFSELPNDAHKCSAIDLFCAYALKDNPRFDVARFKEACR